MRRSGEAVSIFLVDTIFVQIVYLMQLEYLYFEVDNARVNLSVCMMIIIIGAYDIGVLLLIGILIHFSLL
jgi:hypothetical protein